MSINIIFYWVTIFCVFMNNKKQNGTNGHKFFDCNNYHKTLYRERIIAINIPHFIMTVVAGTAEMTDDNYVKKYPRNHHESNTCYPASGICYNFRR